MASETDLKGLFKFIIFTPLLGYNIYSIMKLLKIYLKKGGVAQ